MALEQYESRSCRRVGWNGVEYKTEKVELFVVPDSSVVAIAAVFGSVQSVCWHGSFPHINVWSNMFVPVVVGYLDCSSGTISLDSGNEHTDRFGDV